MSVKARLGRFFHNIFHPFVVVFGKLFGQEATQKFGEAALQMLNSALGKIAWAAVQAVSTLASDGAGKRDAAFKQIVGEAKKAGIDFKDSIVNLLIEMAVQKLKGNA